MQQRFNTGCEVGHSTNIIFYGEVLHLDENMNHFVYDGVIYKIRYSDTLTGMKTIISIARSGRKGPVNVNYREHHYIASNGKQNFEFIIMQTNDVNTYLHDKYELKYVSFRGMRFDMAFENEAAF
jgi:hypothetical protein